jgi:hypothetical protein
VHVAVRRMAAADPLHACHGREYPHRAAPAAPPRPAAGMSARLLT